MPGPGKGVPSALVPPAQNTPFAARAVADARRDQEATLAGQTVGDYTLISPIGYGGMGTVWLARRSDGRFEGLAAVKLLYGSLIGRDGEQRFKREGTILARLAHPSIAHLIDAGVSPGGQPYLVLEYVKGEHIDRYCVAVLEEAMTIARTTIGAEHPTMAMLMTNRARVHLARRDGRGDARAAARLLTRALRINTRTFPENDYRVAVNNSILGQALTAQARYAEAETNLLVAHRVLKDMNPQRNQIAAHFKRLAALYEVWGPPRSGGPLSDASAILICW